jgi:Raf kinase inhibitor-like YbhB/YbcL family protein
MKKLVLTLALLLPVPALADMVLTSPDFTDQGTLANAHVFNGFGCSGENKSPALAWSGVPEGTKALALTVYDPDAPTGSGWWHWVVFNISALSPSGTLMRSGMLMRGAVMPPEAIQSMTDFGTTGYGGPCPPVGDAPHRYIFTLYALKDIIPLDAKASGAMVGFYINQLAIDLAVLTGKYGR